MGTMWRDTPINNFMIHDIALSESGYNYYLYIHAVNGEAIIMREKIDNTEYRYTNAGIRREKWATRNELTYTTYDKLV